MDHSGNVLVTGRSLDSVTGRYDYATVKYSPEGQELWVARYDHAHLTDEPHAMAVDAAGNVYVTGESQVYFPSLYRADYATVKYSPEGEELWVARYDAAHQNDEAYALALDGRGHVYVTGTSNGDILGDGTDSTGHDIATVKYDTAGNELWVARAGMQGTERGYALGVDPGGNVIVTGSASIRSDYPVGLTVKYDSLGNELWRAVFEYMNPPADLVVDSAGCVYVFGTYDGVATDFCIAKYDPDGRECWARFYNGPGNSWDDPQAMAIDGSANIYVTGWSVGQGTGYDFCTIKYDSAGNEKWVARYDSGFQTDWPFGVATNGSDVYVVGRSLDRYCVIRYAPSGELLWSALLPSDSVGGDAFDVTVDEDGNAYVTGVSRRENTGYDYLTVKVPREGVGVLEPATGPRLVRPWRPATVWQGVVRLPAGVRASLLDVSGRRVMDLVPGENDISHLAPGIYFLRPASGVGRPASGVSKVIVQR